MSVKTVTPRRAVRMKQMQRWICPFCSFGHHKECTRLSTDTFPGIPYCNCLSRQHMRKP